MIVPTPKIPWSKTNPIRILILAVLVLTAVIFIGCTDDDTDNDNSTTLTASNQTITTAYETALNITLGTSGEGDDSVSFTVSTPGHGTLTGTAPTLVYTPATGYSGSDSFTYSFSTNEATSNTATISITVLSEDDSVEGVVYVDTENTSGNEDGTSWATAYTSLADALNAAISDDEIWVAAGTYKPTEGNDREASFVMKEGVDIYGGFDGVDDDNLTDRDPDTHVIILSGDIGVSDDVTDNSYHVLFGATNGTIDGFTIRDGQADGLWFNSRGGGLLCYDSNSPTVNNCIFTNNYAVEGGAVAAYYNSAPTITGCTITLNSAERAAGILFRTGPDTQATGASISDTTFSINTANDRGGAVYIDYGAWPSFTGCSFDSNTAIGNGGAVYVDNNSSQLAGINTWFDTCDFNNNSSRKRGGAFAIYEGTVHLSDSTISGNSAGTGGGGIALDYRGSYDDDSSTISGNSSTTGDADVDDDSSSGFGP